MTGLSIPPDHYLRPVVARVQDHLDGGTDNYLVDREFAQDLLAVAPWLPASVRINRAHGPRILDYFTQELGIDQVIDLGCGLPHDDHLGLPDAVRRIVYVDSDPAVEAHARMILAERHGTASLLANLTDMPALLVAPPIRKLDHDHPIGVLLHDVLPWLDDDTSRTVLETLHAQLPPGSVLSLTHATGDFTPAEHMRRLTEIYQEAGIPFRPRTGTAIETLLGQWTPLGSNGLVTTATWLPPSAAIRRSHGMHARLDHSHAYAAIATTGHGPHDHSAQHPSLTTGVDMTDRPTQPPHPETPLPKIKRRRQLTGEEAATFSKQVVDAYARMSIRAICEKTGRSYGAIHRVLQGAGVTFRPRGYQHPPAPGSLHGEE